jgi:hypothetical protein
MSKVLQENFPRLESQSRKQMKDVELVANLLLSLEEGIKGYSQDELDEAFSDREQEWEKSADVRSRFTAAITAIAEISSKPLEAPLYKTRLRNQADFYSLFTAVAECLATGIDCKSTESVARLAGFIGSVEDESLRAASLAATDYFAAARSNSNDSGPRKKRHEIMLKVLNGSIDDYTGTNPE